MTHGSLFSGIGGFDLAAQWMGWENKFHCEWNEFGQKVLHHYWPEAELFTDITKSDFTKYHGTIDIISGGFPCQPYSMAGKRLGKEDDRHLFPEMLRVIREVRPRWVVGENVLGLVNWNGGLVFHEVQTDLEAEGYEVQPYVLPAAAVGAPHRRDRVWFVAYSGMYANGLRTKRGMDMGGQLLEGRERQKKTNRFDIIGANDVTDTNVCTTGSSREGGSLERSWSENNDEPGQWGGKAEQHSGRLNVQRDAADTDSNGQQRSDGEHEKQPSERGVNAQRDIEQSVVDGDAANPNGKRFEQHEFTPITIKQKRFNSEKNFTTKPESWEKFPTQSPICGRNDGLPNQLDGITFSKWRNESIKAFGNAVVPALVYQIFKTIEEYENKYL